MLCEMCKKNKANVHITRIINGTTKQANVCEECAKQMSGFNISADMNVNSPFTFQNILGGIMDYINQPTQDNIDSISICENCKTTYKDFRETGLVGCSECYEKFNNMIMPVVRRVQGSIEHSGKIPKKFGKDILYKKKVNKLKEELQKAIAVEEYERAAEIRDMIKSITNNENRGDKLE
ncbi:UvrB/UvrC motif-containing protein [Clostridium rectalis]|uniref:UvrB/UvrC motif-containing protein n=1 Tax=Clostridium rectalis TaxID=2040295 RepID=UPI000F632260|nr:UvrB/UvrC motif-containing protein [Clostridium rectalis]